MCRKLLFLIVFAALLCSTNITKALDEPVAYYPMEEGSGTIVGDASGNGNDGTIVGTLDWVQGAPDFGTGLDFPSEAGNYVNCGTFNPSGSDDIMTVTAWFKMETIGGWQCIVGKAVEESAGTVLWQLTVSTNGAVGAKISTTGFITITDNDTITEGEWYHVALVKNGTDGELFLNGESVGDPQTDLGAFSEDGYEYPVMIGVVRSFLFNGVIDEVAIFDAALSQEDIQAVRDGALGVKGLAGGANPANGADDILPKDITLSWKAGEFADTHDVYFSTNFDDVNDGIALISEGQDETSYYVGDLELETTYYWRIDEVNAPSNPGTIQGKVWSFTTEAIGYTLPAESIIRATASSSYEDSDPNNTINKSGLDVNDMHSADSDEMWLSDGSGPGESWIKYEFDNIYRLHQMKVWNFNATPPLYYFGFKDVKVEYSVNDQDWYPLTDVPQFARADGAEGYLSNTTVDFGGVEAKYVKLTAESNWGIIIYNQYGLSEVRFLYVPMRARYPNPEDEEADVDVDATLSWRAGREAESHDVYYGTDEAAVASEAVSVNNISETELGPLSLNLGNMYYWKVNEVDSNNVWDGSLWSFSTQEYIIVEDFEFYTDNEPNRVWDFWADGWDDDNNGSTMGYPDPDFDNGEHFVETTVVYNGDQSGPVLYDNTAPVNYSEVTLVLDSAQNWSGNGADEVVMSFRGNAVEFYESDDGYIAMSAEGVDIYGTEDEFRYAYKTLQGDGSITVRVDSIETANVWSKAGIMIRNSLDANDVHVTAILAANDIAEFESRSEMGGTTSNTDVADFGAPCWLRITRTGDDFTAECSKDGLEWQSFEADANNATTINIDMGNTVYIGLVVTSHEPDVAAAATFYNPTTTGNVTGDDWTVEVIGADTEFEVVNTIDKLYVALEDSSGSRHDVYAPVITAVGWGDWYEWIIPQSEFSTNGVNMTRVKKIIVGVGDPSDPMNGSGMIFIDDIGYGHGLPAEQ